MAVVAKHFIVGKGVHHPDPNRSCPVSAPLHTHHPEGPIQAIVLISAPRLPGQNRKSLLFRSSYWRPAFRRGGATGNWKQPQAWRRPCG